jgi:hypothetical protein
MEEVRNTIFVGEREERRQVCKRRHSWEGNIKMYLKEIWYDILNWIEMAEDWVQWCAVVSMVMGLRIPENAENSLAN